MQNSKQLKWTPELEIKAFHAYIYNYSPDQFVDMLIELDLLDKYDSFICKLLNYKYLDTGYGLKNCSKLTIEMWDEYLAMEYYVEQYQD